MNAAPTLSVRTGDAQTARHMICCTNCGTCKEEIETARAAFPQLENPICCEPGDNSR